MSSPLREQPTDAAIRAYNKLPLWMKKDMLGSLDEVSGYIYAGIPMLGWSWSSDLELSIQSMSIFNVVGDTIFISKHEYNPVTYPGKIEELDDVMAIPTESLFYIGFIRKLMIDAEGIPDSIRTLSSYNVNPDGPNREGVITLIPCANSESIVGRGVGFLEIILDLLFHLSEYIRAECMPSVKDIDLTSTNYNADPDHPVPEVSVNFFEDDDSNMCIDISSHSVAHNLASSYYQFVDDAGKTKDEGEVNHLYAEEKDSFRFYFGIIRMLEGDFKLYSNYNKVIVTPDLVGEIIKDRTTSVFSQLIAQSHLMQHAVPSGKI